MKQPKRIIDAVFEGGGVKCIGLAGALSPIEDAGYGFVNIAGNSGGSIVATLLASGYTSSEIRDIIMKIDWNELMDMSSIRRIPLIGPSADIVTQMGMYNGDTFLELMRDLLAQKGVKTFRDFVMPEFANDSRYRFKVRVIASDVSRGRMLVLPQDIKAYGMAPEELQVALAVRMSMSIPFFYKPVRIRESNIVDGMLLSNYPLGLFDESGTPPWPTFGFRTVNTNAPVVMKHDITDPVSVLTSMFATAMDAQDARYIRDSDFVRTIPIETLGFPATDFSLSADQKQELYKSGVKAAHEFLRDWDFEQYKALYRSGKTIPSRHTLTMRRRVGPFEKQWNEDA